VKQYLGIDIVEISRIEQDIARWGETFLDRLFTPAEKERYRDRPESLAARFAAKEAAVKALGCKEIIYQDIEVVNDSAGKPSIALHGRAKSIADDLGISDLAVSLAHSREYAAAVVSALA